MPTLISCCQLSDQVRTKMILYKVLLTIFLFLKSGVAEEIDDPCSKFDSVYGPFKKCPSEKPEDDYLECYDYRNKEAMEQDNKHK